MSKRDARSAAKINRMIRPEALKKDEPLFWSPGNGSGGIRPSERT